jgi:predicted small secreted protein
MRKAAWFFLLLAITGLCGCETVKGVGRDLVSASALVQNGFSKN